MKEYKNAQAWSLSACLISEIAVTKVIEKLTIDNFSEPELGNIFKAINSLFSKNTKIDILTLSSEMKKLGMEVNEGWLYTDFEDAVFSDDHIDEHIDIILKYTLKNNVKKLTAKITNKVGANEPIKDTIDFARESFMNIDTNNEEFVFTAQEAVMSAIKQTDNIHNNKVQVGLQTNIYDLNKKVIFKPADLIVIAAKKSVGKTVLLNQIAFFNARKGNKGVLINLEMRKEDIINREIARVGEIDYADISMGKMNKEQLERYQKASEEISQYPIIISTKRGLTVTQIHSKLLMFKNKLGRLDFVIIDYIQKIRTPKGHSRQRELASLSDEFGAMAQHFNCPFFIGSQVNHEGITREAEDLENDADVVLKLRREVFEYKSKFIKTTQFPQKDGLNMPEDYATLQITKNRNGRTGGIELRSALAFQRFEDWFKTP
jgi:replicative DNA helicase